MAFFFHVPNLLVAEALFLMVGTYYFTRYYWGPAIVTALSA
jgi:hypothetical protein